MRHKQVLCAVAVAVAVPALWAASRPGDTVSFHPAEGLALTKRFVEKTEQTLESMTISMNGEEMDASMLGDPEMSVSATTTRVVSDTYVRLAGGRPAQLSRTYDELSSDGTMSMQMGPMGGDDVKIESSSELEGLTVLFAWNEEAGDYRVSFPEGQEGDAELLEGLTEDMDLRGLLPAGEVAPEDTWELDVNALIPVLAPGGELKIMPDNLDELSGGMMGQGAGPGPGGDISQILGALEGTASGTYVGKRTVDDVECAAIKIVFKVSSARDMTEEVKDMLDGVELPEEVGSAEIDVDSMDVEFEFEGEGVLLWNLEGGHLHSLEFSGETYMALDTAVKITIQGMGEMENEQGMEFSGTTTISVTVTPR